MAEPTRFTRTRLRALIGLLGGLALIVGGCSPLDEGSDSPSLGPTGDGLPGGQLTIATGGTGGVYYVLGGGLGTVIGDSVPGYSATAQETNASVDNMQLIASGGADIAFSLADTAADAVEGREAFEGAPVSACALGLLYSNYTQLVTSADSGVTSVEDLRGKPVSLGSPGSGTEVIALRILEDAGIDPDADIDRQQLGIDDTVAALRDGTIAAGFWSGGLPTGALTEYASSGEMVIVPTGDSAAGLQEAYGEFYVAGEIPADSYEGQADAVSTVVVPNVLVVSSEMPEDLQRQLTAALFDNKDALAQVHPEASNLDAATAGDLTFMDVCPGSQTYFDEQG
ncbi:MAG TPA: TAXI family TRAP transporter solute-binding subunit [Candidatus Dormibacteraeota bacterium]|nr:TAXI family TRAP transporter solute-binding subunit [Candidatus Dormibacteraeota bacterium]